MVDSILASPDLVPATVPYNGLDAPFAYPPLAFLLTAGLERLVPLGTVEWLRWIPLIASIATVPAFALLALEIAPTRVHAAIATFVFAVTPRAFDWLIMGGGLARAPGMLFAILAIYFLARYLRAHDRTWIAAGLALGLAVVTHPQAGLFGALSMALLALARARGRTIWLRVAGSAVIGLAVALPWLGLVISRNGAGPLASAGGTSPNLAQSAYYLLTAKLTDEPLWTLTAGLAALGAIYLLATRRFLVPAWVAAVVIIDPRGASTVVSVPLALLAASGLLDVIVARIIGVGGSIDEAPGWPVEILRRRATAALLVGALTLGMLSAFLAPYLTSSMASLSPDARSAMRWVNDTLPSSTRVVVVTGRSWYEDATSEWFPYLADRESVATVQGYEWLGAAAWQGQLDLAASLQEVSNAPVSYLEAWATRQGVAYDVVFVPKGKLGAVTGPADCCTILRDSLRASGGFSVIYDGPGATVAVRDNP